MKGIVRHYNLNHFGMSTTVVRRESCSAKRSLASRRGTPSLLMLILDAMCVILGHGDQPYDIGLRFGRSCVQQKMCN